MQPVPEFNLSNIELSSSKNITEHSYWDFDPEFSPDGTRIAFHSNRPPSPGNVGQIYVMSIGGTNLRMLTNSEGTNYGAAWSPDGRQIAFTSERDGNPEVYIMNADGSDQRNLSNNPHGYDAGAQWSPDGKSIAYFSGEQKPVSEGYIPSGQPYRYWNADLYILDLDSGHRRQITMTDHDDIYPAWSSDGKRIAFTSSRDGNNEIYIINVDGSGERRITNSISQDNAAAWLPGDSQISFNRSETVEGQDRASILTFDLREGRERYITRKEDESVYFNGDISPNGGLYTFSAFTVDGSAFRGERADIYVAELEPRN